MVIINEKKPKQFLTLTKNGCCYILTSHSQQIYMSVHISGSESIEFIMMINSSCHYQNIASSSLCFVTTIFYCIIITIINNTLFIAHRLSHLYCLYDHYMYSKLLILKCFNAILKFLTKNKIDSINLFIHWLKCVKWLVIKLFWKTSEWTD